MELRVGRSVFGEAGDLASVDGLVAYPCGGGALVCDGAANLMLAGEVADLTEGRSGRLRAEDGELRGEPEVGEVVGVGVGNGEWGFVSGEEHAHPDAGEGDVGLHVHAVGAVVGAGDVAQVRMIEGGDVGQK